MKVYLTNDFHGSEIAIRFRPENVLMVLSPNQLRRARKQLCGIEGCTCGGPAGERGGDWRVVPEGKAYRVERAAQ